MCGSRPSSGGGIWSPEGSDSAPGVARASPRVCRVSRLPQHLRKGPLGAGRGGGDQRDPARGAPVVCDRVVDPSQRDPVVARVADLAPGDRGPGLLARARRSSRLGDRRRGVGWHRGPPRGWPRRANAQRAGGACGSCDRGVTAGSASAPWVADGAHARRALRLDGPPGVKILRLTTCLRGTRSYGRESRSASTSASGTSRHAVPWQRA